MVLTHAATSSFIQIQVFGVLDSQNTAIQVQLEQGMCHGQFLKLPL